MRSTEELFDKLAEERVWRIKEISAIKNLAQSKAGSPVEEDFYCRAAATLFYAHWEGFVKRAATYYLKYISFQRLQLDEMADFVACLYVRQFLPTADLPPEKIIQFKNRFENEPNFRPKLQWKNLVHTGSNLSSKILSRIIELLGLDYRLYEPKANFIDLKILANRNAIAHGDKGDILIADVENLADEVTGLITLFRDQIENAVTLRAYKRP
jgi:hypothetical protein